MTPDYYATLGIEPGASAPEVRAAYLRSLRTHHPDRNPSPAAASQTQEIIAAFKVLGDFDRRSRYDWDRRRDREAAEAATAPRPVNRAALFAGGMVLVALSGLLMKPDRLRIPPARLAAPPVRVSEPVRPVELTRMTVVRMKHALPRPALSEQTVNATLQPEPKTRPKPVKREGEVAERKVTPTVEPRARHSKIAEPTKDASEASPPAPAADLASLDQFVMKFFNQSWRYGDAAKRAALAQSRADFAARRAACVADPCARAAYLALMRDVSAIVESRKIER